MRAHLKHSVEGIYSRLPFFLQNVAFTGWGYWTRRQRYGRYFHETLERLRESEWSTGERIRESQNAALQAMIADVAENVPYYSELFRSLKLAPSDFSTVEDLQKLPILTKEVLRQDPSRFVNRRFKNRELVYGLTSGTTGSPLRLAYTRETVQFQWAVWWRHRARFGLSLGDRFLMFGARLPVLDTRDGAPFWRHNRAIRQTYLSTYHIKPATLHTLVEWLNSEAFDFFTGYPSAISALARMMTAEGLRLYRRPKYVVTGSDALLPSFERTISKTFGVPVTEQYGMAEAVGNFAKCERGAFHLDHEFGIAELLPIAESPGQKRLVLTGLRNPAMPLLRYDVGDFGEEGDGCECGRATTVLKSISGRIEDYVVTPDGRIVIGLNQVFEWAPNLWESQVRQEREDAIEVLIVPRPSFGPADTKILERELRYRVGDTMRIEFRLVDSIAREPNGKFRGVVSEVSRRRLRSDAASPASG